MDEKTVKDDDGKVSTEELIKLRDLTRRTGLLTEAQVNHLKYWPMIVDSCIVGCEAHFNYDKSELEYQMKVKEKVLPKDFENRLKKLEEWSQFLLGNEYLIKVKVNGKLIFRGHRMKAPPIRKNTRNLDKNYLDELEEDYLEDKEKIDKWQKTKK
ncbi:MAG: hypothetical protein KGO96_07455 [Elusimicrobia bacterium]|nr:hypothetical protein [Elusimicrobiota bacterium]